MARKRPRKRVSLAGWWKCLPILAVPCSFFFAQVWLQTAILTNHYRANELKQQIEELRESILQLQNANRRLERLERISDHAPGLGLHLPNPGQVKEILPQLEDDDTGKLLLRASARETVPTRSVLLTLTRPGESVPVQPYYPQLADTDRTYVTSEMSSVESETAGAN